MGAREGKEAEGRAEKEGEWWWRELRRSGAPLSSPSLRFTSFGQISRLDSQQTERFWTKIYKQASIQFSLFSLTTMPSATLHPPQYAGPSRERERGANPNPLELNWFLSLSGLEEVLVHSSRSN